MSSIPELTGGRALVHNLAFEAGKGISVKGQAALLSSLSGATNLLAHKSEAITCAGDHTLLVSGTAAANQTVIKSNVIIMDPGGAGRNITLPAEASSTGLLLFLFNAADADEGLVIRSDEPATIVTVGQSEGAVLFCDGTTWRGLVGGNT